jgi:hypothetical protein
MIDRQFRHARLVSEGVVRPRTHPDYRSIIT